MNPEPPFRRILVAHTGPQVERDLLEYAERLTAGDPESRTLVAAFPSNGVLRSLAPAARSVFRSREAGRLSLQLFTEPELDSVFEAASGFGADLILMRRPEERRQARSIARRLLGEARCSVCLLPPGPAPRIKRAVAGVELSATGRELLARGARLCTQAGAGELVALHSFFRSPLCDGDELAENQRQRRLLDLYRLLPRKELTGLDCTPLIEESPSPERALLRAIREHAADVVVVGRSGAPRFLLGRPSPIVEKLAWSAPAALFQIQLSSEPVPMLKAIETRFFPNSEPRFN